MVEVRVFYQKTGRMKYISHLDLNRCFSRALKRSGLPVWYTEGFNPHIYLTFALPLSLGYESLCESMDFRLIQPIPFEEVKKRLNGVLMPGLTVTGVAEPVHKPTEITMAEYNVFFPLQEKERDEFLNTFPAFCGSEKILVQKKTKKGEKEIDIRPLTQLLGVTGREDGAEVRLRLAAGGNLNINPSLLIDCYLEKQDLCCESVSVTRTAVLLENGENFA